MRGQASLRRGVELVRQQRIVEFHCPPVYVGGPVIPRVGIERIGGVEGLLLGNQLLPAGSAPAIAIEIRRVEQHHAQQVFAFHGASDVAVVEQRHAANVRRRAGIGEERARDRESRAFLQLARPRLPPSRAAPVHRAREPAKHRWVFQARCPRPPRIARQPHLPACAARKRFAALGTSERAERRHSWILLPLPRIAQSGNSYCPDLLENGSPASRRAVLPPGTA